MHIENNNSFIALATRLLQPATEADYDDCLRKGRTGKEILAQAHYSGAA